MPAPAPFDCLTRFERLAVRLVRRMNRGRWQRLWCWCQRELGARWIAALVEPLFEVHGLEHVEATSRARPLVVVPNHRTWFDLYVVATVLFRRTRGWRALNFPVRARYCYQGVGGLLVNFLAAWWAMYPPFFLTPAKRRFDRWALEELAALCQSGEGRLVGYHPEGTRNKGSDPWSLLPAHPGIGRLIHEARPVVIPVFIGGLTHDLPAMLRRRWRGGERIRIRFGPAFEYGDFLAQPPGGPTYQALADRLMAEVARLGAADRAEVDAGRLSQPRPA